MVPMITFAALRTTAPDIADPIAARLEKSVLGMLGTIRRDGSPRVSPIEVAFHEGRLYVGMMPGSTKSQDVGARPAHRRWSRALADKDDLGGEGKLFGDRRRRITDVDLAERILRQHATDGGFDPESIAGSPMYEILVNGAAWQFVRGRRVRDPVVERGRRPPPAPSRRRHRRRRRRLTHPSVSTHRRVSCGAFPHETLGCTQTLGCGCRARGG